jgi:hypothetical protein
MLLSPSQLAGIGPSMIANGLLGPINSQNTQFKFGVIVDDQMKQV